MVNNFFKIAIVIVCFSTKPLFAQSLNYGYLKLTKDVNSVNLIMASKYGSLEDVISSLDAGADVNAVYVPSGWTPLMFAGFNGHLEIVESLLEAGANVNHQTDMGKTALTYARRQGHTEIVGLLEEAGATE